DFARLRHPLLSGSSASISTREELPMPLRIRCPGCQALADIPDSMAGQKVRCKQCQKVFQVGAVPAAKPKAAEPPPRPAKPKAVDPPPPPARRKPPVEEEVPVELEAELEEGVQSRPSPKPARRPAPKVSARAVAPREPRHRPESSPALKWIIGGVIALLLLGGGVTLALILQNREPEKQTAEDRKKEDGKG